MEFSESFEGATLLARFVASRSHYGQSGAVRVRHNGAPRINPYHHHYVASKNAGFPTDRRKTHSSRPREDITNGHYPQQQPCTGTAR